MRTADRQQLYLHLSLGPVCSGKVQLTWVLTFYLKCSQRLRRPLECHLLPAELLPELPEPWERWLDLHSSSSSGWARPFPVTQCSLPETGKAESKSPCFHTHCYFALQKPNLKYFINVCRTMQIYISKKHTQSPLEFTFPWSKGGRDKGSTTSGLTLYRASVWCIMNVLACWLRGLLYPTADTGLFIICWLLEKNRDSGCYTLKPKAPLGVYELQHLQIPCRNLFQHSRNHPGCIWRSRKEIW